MSINDAAGFSRHSHKTVAPEKIVPAPAGLVNTNPIFAVVLAGMVTLLKMVAFTCVFPLASKGNCRPVITALSVELVKFLTDILNLAVLLPAPTSCKEYVTVIFHLVGTAGATKVLDEGTQYPGRS